VESCDGLTAVIIEGNYSDQVKRRTISINGRYIRGYGVPKYHDGTAYTVGWNHDSKGWWYATSASTYYRGTWAVINHHWYYFGEDGYILTGVQNIGGKVYYLMEDGDLQGALCITDDKGSLFPWFVD
jgi:glucan-binding YG repeat protein